MFSVQSTRLCFALVAALALSILNPLVDHPLRVFAASSSAQTSPASNAAVPVRQPAVAAAAITPPPAYPSVIDGDHPLVYYRLNESGCCVAADSSGHGTNGTYAASGVSYGVPGLQTGDSDPAIASAVNGPAVTASDSSLPSGSAARTVELWIKTSTPWQSLLSYGQNGNGGFYFMVSMHDANNLVFVGGNDNAVFPTPYPLNDGTAHYIALTYDVGSTVTGYVDGQQIGQSVIGTLQTPLGQGLQVGGGGDGPFSGTLDEVAVYAGALSPSQINSHWRAGVGAGCAAIPTVGYAGSVALDNPVRYWRLGEGSGRAALDYSAGCRDAAYGAGATHQIGLLAGDPDGSVGSPTPAGTIVNASADGLPTTGARTVEFWERTAGSWQSFLSYGQNTNGGFYFLVSMHGPSNLDFIGANSNAEFATPYPLNDGAAHQIAIAYDGGQVVTGYLDGQRLGQAVLQARLNTILGAQALEIGNGGDGPFVGTLDEVAVYPAALATARINAHWQAGVAAAACPSTPTSGYAKAVVSDGPSRYWRLGESAGQAALDYSGSCADAAYASGVTHVPGLLPNDADGAVASATPAGTIASASVDGLPTGSSARTVEFWERTTNPWQSFVSYGQNTNGGFYFMVSAHGASSLTFIGANDNAVFPTPYPLNDGAAHHVALTYDGGTTLTAYLDGQQIGQSHIGQLFTEPGAQAFQIGNGADGPFVGTIDEVAVYPSALSAAQIAAHDAGAGPVISGTVMDGTTPMAGALVQACSGASGATCIAQTVTTSSTGAFLFRPPPGTYAVTAFPAPNTIFSGAVTVGPISVPPTATNLAISLSAPAPANGTFVSAGFGSQQGVSPTVNWSEPSTYTVSGCPNGFGFLGIVARNTATGRPDVRINPLVESPAGSGIYLARIPPLAPLHGDASVTQMIHCGTASPIFPGGGPPAGGTKVLLFVGNVARQVTAVNFGSTPAQSFAALANTGFLTAISPPGTGVVQVSVSTPSTSVPIGSYTYLAVTGVSPNSGTGGTTVTISGTGFHDVLGVLFDGIPTSFNVDSPTQITAVAPSGSGQGSVTVIEPTAATESDSNSLWGLLDSHSSTLADIDQELFKAIISAISKDLAADALGAAGGDTLAGMVLDGLFAAGLRGLVFTFLGDAGVALIGVAGFAAIAALVEVILAAAVLIAGLVLIEKLVQWRLKIDPSGTVMDSSGNPIGGATSSLLQQALPGGGFSTVPAASGIIAPAVNPQTTGPSGAFHWDAVQGTYEVEASAGGCTAPANPSETTVTSPAFSIPPPKVGLLLTLTCPGTAPPLPAITLVTPPFGPAAGGTQVEIGGIGFGAAPTVRFGSTPASSVLVLSPYAVLATAPSGTPTSQVDITVATAGGTSVTSSADHFTYFTPQPMPAAPTITSVAPASGPVVGGNLVTINGTNLETVIGLSFADTPATLITQLTPTQIKVIAPASLVGGRVDVVASNGAGSTVPSASDSYFYGSGIPTSLTVSASSNPSVFGQPVTYQAAASSGATGTVQFAVDGTNLGAPVPLSGGQATSPATTALGIGTHAVTATYAGSSGFLGSNGSLTQTVNRAATSTTVSSSLNPSIVNNPVTFAITVAPVAPGAGTPTGTVQYAVNGATLGAPVALANGRGSLTTSALATGHDVVTATYSGDGNFTGTTSVAITQVVRNNVIAFSSTRDGNPELYLMKPDGSGQTRLTSNPAIDAEPILSPDGTQIAFVSTRRGNADIWVMKTAPESSTNVARNLTNNGSVDADATWSPDARRIVFTSTRSGRSQLWVTNADGSGTASRLVTDAANDINPAWSPDGTRLAYASDATGKFQLYVATLTSSLAIVSTVRLTTDTASDATPAWSSDSRLIAFTGTATGNPEIWVIPGTGGAAIRETSNPSSADAGPTWSPDASAIAFTHGTGSAVTVYAIMFNASGLGTGQTALTTANTSELPNWCCTGAP